MQFGRFESIHITDRSLSTRAIARIISADNGGSIRTIIDGRQRRPTGTFPSVKAGFRSMPWDSFLEDRAMKLADLSSRVRYLMSQPHRLEIMITGNRGRPLIYFPDLLLKVHPDFVHDLRSGRSFAEVVGIPISHHVADQLLETVVIEIKANLDSRDGDAQYRAKLEFAEEVYRRCGFHYFELREAAHFSSEAPWVRLMDWRKFTSIVPSDIQCCIGNFGRRERTQAWKLEEALGGGNLGRAKLIALHYRGLISVDLRDGLTHSADVWLVKDMASR